MKPLFRVRCFGVVIESELAFPEMQACVPPRENEPVQLSVEYGECPEKLKNPAVYQKEGFSANQQELLCCFSGLRVYVANGVKILVQAAPGCHPDFIRSAVFGMGLAAALTQRGLYLFHASGVAVSGGAVVLTGRSGAGKSTLSAALVQRGYPLLTEDLCAMRLEQGELRIQPGFGAIRLCEDSAEVVAEEQERLGYTVENQGKHIVKVETLTEELPPLCIAEVVRCPGDSFRVEAVKGMEKFQILSHNLVLPFVLGLGSGCVTSFHQCVHACRSVPFYRIWRPDGFDFTHPLLDTLLERLQVSKEIQI